MEEVNREVRQFGVAVPGGMERVSLMARTLHETGNWLVLTDCANAFNAVRRTAVLAEVDNCVTALTPLEAKCHGTKTRWRVFPDGLRGDQKDRLLQRCPAGRPHGAGNVLPDAKTGAEAFPRGV